MASILHHCPTPPTFRARLLSGTALTLPGAAHPALAARLDAPARTSLAARLTEAAATWFRIRQIEAQIRQRFGPGGAVYDTRRFGWPG